jgi:hypothetical protein
MSFCREWGEPAPIWRGFHEFLKRGTLDKMTHTKKEAPAEDRKHLTGLEVERLIQAAEDVFR